MASRDELFQALRNADASGDEAGARRLAQYIQTLPAEAAAPASSKEEPLVDRMLGGVKQAIKFHTDAAAGAMRGARDVVDTGAKLLATGYDKLTGADQPTTASLVTGQPQGEAARVEAINKAGRDEFSRQYGDSTAASLGRVGGNVAVTLPVGPLLGGGARLLGMERFGNALASSGMSTGATVAPNALARVGDLALRSGAGAVTGGVSAGLVNPDDAGTGAAIGAALPPVAMAAGAAGRAVGGTVRGLLEPLSQGGRDVIVGRALNTAAGREAPQVAQRLEEAGRPFVGPSQGAERVTMGELVPGSLPTVGQAAGNAGVASLERAATATNPEMTNLVADRLRAQNAARVDVLDRMAGADGARDFAVANRDATSNQLFGAARATGISPRALTPAAQQNIADFQARMPPEVLERARKLAQISGKPMDDTTSLTGLDWTRQALGNLIENAKTAGDTQLARAYTGLQRDFVDGITKLSPEYGDALKVHAQMSAPINAMDTAQRIRDTSVDKLTGNLRPSSLANSMVDKTAQRATGFSGATLDNTLSNTDRNALAGLLSDVQRSTAATNSAGSAGSDTVKKLAYTNMLDQAGVPSMLRNARGGQIVGNLAGRAGQAIYGDANRQIANQLAEVMLNPGAAAELMRRATPSQRNALMGLLEHSGVPQIAVRSAPAIEASR